MHYVYILENKQGRYYIGSCEDLERRIKRHNQNSVRSTKHKGPFRVIYKATFETKREARRQENELKGYKSSVYLKKLIEKATPSSSLV